MQRRAGGLLIQRIPVNSVNRKRLLATTHTATTPVTEAPSYAPTTETYAPTLGACPPLGVLRPDQCPLDTTGLPPCTDVGLGLSARCVANSVEIAATTTWSHEI